MLGLNGKEFRSITVLWVKGETIDGAESPPGFLAVVLTEDEDTFRGFDSNPDVALDKAFAKQALSDNETGPITLTIVQGTGETSLEHLRAKDLKKIRSFSVGIVYSCPRCSTDLEGTMLDENLYCPTCGENIPNGELE